jgi:hypothetical protein
MNSSTRRRENRFLAPLRSLSWPHMPFHWFSTRLLQAAEEFFWMRSCLAVHSDACIFVQKHFSSIRRSCLPSLILVHHCMAIVDLWSRHTLTGVDSRAAEECVAKRRGSGNRHRSRTSTGLAYALVLDFPFYSKILPRREFGCWTSLHRHSCHRTEQVLDAAGPGLGPSSCGDGAPSSARRQVCCACGTHQTKRQCLHSARTRNLSLRRRTRYP